MFFVVALVKYPLPFALAVFLGALVGVNVKKEFWVFGHVAFYTFWCIMILVGISATLFLFVMFWFGIVGLSQARVGSVDVLNDLSDFNPKAANVAAQLGPDAWSALEIDEETLCPHGLVRCEYHPAICVVIRRGQ